VTKDGPGRGPIVFVELLRLLVVGVFVASGYAIATTLSDVTAADAERSRFLASVIGALLGYVLGGFVGRWLVRGVDRAQRNLERVEASTLIAALVGGALTATVAFALTWPVLLLPAKAITLPIAAAVIVAAIYAGGRIGSSRAGDLRRYIGVRGRIEVQSPSRGGGVKLLDTSALVDARVLEVARAGFLEGTLVVPQFVLMELQGLADSGEPSRRQRGRRGLDALRTLQTEGVVGVEMADDEAPGVQEVDAKLLAMAKQREAALITVDSNLAQVAEISGVRVLSLHVMAEALRPPVLPGQHVELHVLREGREPGQGVGYLEDTTMVVIEDAAQQVGQDIEVEVTSVVQNRNGRLVFATRNAP